MAYLKEIGLIKLYFLKSRRRKRFKRTDDEKKVLRSYLHGEQGALHAAEQMFRAQQHYTPGKLLLVVPFIIKL